MKIAAILLLFAASTVAAAMAFFHRPMWLFFHQEFRVGNEMIARVEIFRASRHSLPTKLEEIGYQEPDEKVFYVKISDDEYCLWFGTELGESETYWSHNRKWEEGRQCVPAR